MQCVPNSIVSFRCCTKPLYRWAFKKGRVFTLASVRDFNLKYIKKYLKKRQKTGVDPQMPEGNEDVKRISKTITNFLCQDMECPPEPSALCTHVCDQHPFLASQTHVTDEICRYCIALHVASISNVGLSHAKVREYWLYRGPRQLMTILMFLAGTLILQETLRDLTNTDRQIVVLTSMLALCTSGIMLYYRLPDSIRSGVCRSAHDHYVRSKKALDRETEAAKQMLDLEADASGNGNSTSHATSEETPSIILDIEMPAVDQAQV